MDSGLVKVLQIEQIIQTIKVLQIEQIIQTIKVLQIEQIIQTIRQTLQVSHFVVIQIFHMLQAFITSKNIIRKKKKVFV